jgi:hypothetical protein
MNTREIEQLLDKYYEGLTSLEEEDLLRTYFREEFVPPHLAPHADLFRSFSASQEEEIPDKEFDEKFLAAISETPVIRMYPLRKRLVYVTSLAAGVLLLIGIFFALRQEMFKSNPTNTITNRNQAYAETKKALMLLAGNFNAGMQQVEKFQAFDKGMTQVETLGSFDRGMTQVRKLSDFYKFQQLVFNRDEIVRP